MINEHNQTKNTSQSPQSQQTHNPDTEMNTEQLSALLKQKLKENKVLQNKNAKLQTRYVEIFRQQKTLKHENQLFNQFFAKHFEPFKPTNEDSFQIQHLQNALQRRDEVLRRKITDHLTKQKEEEKWELQNRITTRMEEKLKEKETKYKRDIENWIKETDSFRKQNKVLLEQRNQLQNRVLARDEEISGLTKEKLKMEHRINSEKMDEINEEIVMISEEKNDKFNEREEIIRLNDQIYNLMEKRDNLREELKKAKQEIMKLSLLIEEKNQSISLLNQKMLLVEEQKQAPIKEREVEKENVPQIKKIADKMEQYEEDIFHEDEDYVHREYMKNVLLRYMKCIKSGDAIHAQILLNVVFTILKFNEEQKKWADRKKKSWWII